MFPDRSRAEFERLFLPQIDAAYNLARLLTRNAQDADDVVQESYLRALRGFRSFRGDAARPWLLAIVRNTCFTWLKQNRGRDQVELDPERHSSEDGTPEVRAIEHERSTELNQCIAELPPDFREAILLREVEQLSYREISQVTGVPEGTVMSRLSRARMRLAECLKRRGAR